MKENAKLRVDGSAVRRFEEWLVLREKSDNTIQKYVRDSAAFCCWVGMSKNGNGNKGNSGSFGGVCDGVGGSEYGSTVGAVGKHMLKNGNSGVCVASIGDSAGRVSYGDVGADVGTCDTAVVGIADGVGDMPGSVRDNGVRDGVCDSVRNGRTDSGRDGVGRNADCGGRVTREMVVQYKELLCDKYAPKSVNSILSSLNAFFEFLGRADLKVKMLKLQRRIFADKDKVLTKAEYQRLLNVAKADNNERLYFLMQTIASTGIRVSEVKYITCDAVRRGQAVINCKGKIRQIFLPKDLCKILKDYAKKHQIKSGAIFITRTGKPLDRFAIWKMLKNLCIKAKVQPGKVFPHNLRHLFARTFYALKKDIVRLADILGHSSVETTRIYTMEYGTEHLRQLQKLGLLQC